MKEPEFDKALHKWKVVYDKATWWFDSWEVANDWYLLNKDKF